MDLNHIVLHHIIVSQSENRSHCIHEQQKVYSYTCAIQLQICICYCIPENTLSYLLMARELHTSMVTLYMCVCVTGKSLPIPILEIGSTFPMLILGTWPIQKLFPVCFIDTMIQLRIVENDLTCSMSIPSGEDSGDRITGSSLTTGCLIMGSRVILGWRDVRDFREDALGFMA